MDTLKFKPIYLGQCIIRYQVPLDIFTSINQIYEQNYNSLAPANGQLVGKIEKEHSLFYEYNPAHIHRGMLYTGLSSVMILKLPSTYGKEYSAEHIQQNGRLQILGASNGQFAKIDYQPPMDLRDFYVFPYDMRHCVYPFNGTDETRRTLAANCDVEFDPIKNRGAN